MWNNVEKILKEKYITIYKLSKLTGISDNTLRNYRSKHSDPSFTNACKIADALGVSLDDLREKEGIGNYEKKEAIQKRGRRNPPPNY